MKKLIEIFFQLSIPFVIGTIKKKQHLLAKKFADSKDIPFIGEKGEEKLAAGVISVMVEFLEDINKK